MLASRVQRTAEIDELDAERHRYARAAHTFEMSILPSWPAGLVCRRCRVQAALVGMGAHRDAGPTAPAGTRIALWLTRALPAATIETSVVQLDKVLAIYGTQAERLRPAAVGSFDADRHSPRIDDCVVYFGRERSTDITH